MFLGLEVAPALLLPINYGLPLRYRNCFVDCTLTTTVTAKLGFFGSGDSDTNDTKSPARDIPTIQVWIRFPLSPGKR